MVAFTINYIMKIAGTALGHLDCARYQLSDGFQVAESTYVSISS